MNSADFNAAPDGAALFWRDKRRRSRIGTALGHVRSVGEMRRSAGSLIRRAWVNTRTAAVSVLQTRARSIVSTVLLALASPGGLIGRKPQADQDWPDESARSRPPLFHPWRGRCPGAVDHAHERVVATEGGRHPRLLLRRRRHVHADGVSLSRAANVLQRKARARIQRVVKRRFTARYRPRAHADRIREPCTQIRPQAPPDQLGSAVEYRCLWSTSGPSGRTRSFRDRSEVAPRLPTRVG